MRGQCANGRAHVDDPRIREKSVAKPFLRCLELVASELTNGRGQAPRLITARAVADRLGVSTETVLRWTRRGLIPGFRLPGGALRYREDEFDTWLRCRATAAESPARGTQASERPAVELSTGHRITRKAGNQDATDATRRGVQAELW
jgi:excisionase family DNA binding protein